MAKIVMAINTVADKAVTLAGTPEAIVGSSTLVSNVTIQWDPANAGNVYIGDSNVAAGRGFIINASNPIFQMSVDDTEGDEDQTVIDLATIYIDAANSGDQVKIGYLAVSSKVY